MSFENPTFNNETKSERELITPDFLQDQIRLPKDQWDKKFRQLIEEKIKENQEQGDETEKSTEVLREQTFRRYMNGLGLNEETIKNKKILDLGSGEGEFVQSLIEKSITPEAYGIDAQMEESSVGDKMKDHLLQGNFEEDLPVQNADYVVSVGAVSNAIWGGGEAMNVRHIVKKSLAILKEDGEIRIYPIQEAAKANPLEGLRASQEKWEKLLKEISTTQNVVYKIEPRNIKVAGNSNDVILESVLVIKRKKQ